MNLRPAKNMSKQPFLEKMSELRMFLRIVGVRSTEQSGISCCKTLFASISYIQKHKNTIYRGVL